MYLKFRYGLGYESLVNEVRDSIQWRRFCRISLCDPVPHATTLVKLTKRYGPGVVGELNRLLLDKAREEKLVRGRKLRVDTTVVEADIHYPTDASLLADGVRVITRYVNHLKKLGVEVKFRDRTRSIRTRLFSINKVLRRRSHEVYQDVRAITGEIMELAKRVVASAKCVAAGTEEFLQNKAVRLRARLQEAIALTEKVLWQTQEVQRGNRNLPERLVSLFDPGARPIRKGKLKSPTEFGRKVLIQETEERIVSGYGVCEGNPSDCSLLKEALESHKSVFSRVPRAVATDRRFSTADNEDFLIKQGVRRVSLPRKGKKTEKRRVYEKESWFRRLQRWRAGGEDTIGLLKSKYGLERSRFRGDAGTQTWVGLGILTYNLRRLTVLAQQ